MVLCIFSGTEHGTIFGNFTAQNHTLQSNEALCGQTQMMIILPQSHQYYNFIKFPVW